MAFVPLQTAVGPDQLPSITNTFNGEVAGVDPSSVAAMQYGIQGSWLETGSVPQVEVIHWGRGFTSPAEGQSYVTLLGGFMVRPRA